MTEMTEGQRIAKELDGVILAFNVSRELQERAKQHNIVIAWGESDDLLELRGAVYDEINANSSDLSALTTTDKTSLIAAINTLQTAIGSIQSGQVTINDASSGGTITWSATKNAVS